MSNELWLLLVGGVGVAAVVLIVTTWSRRRDLTPSAIGGSRTIERVRRSGSCNAFTMIWDWGAPSSLPHCMESSAALHRETLLRCEKNWCAIAQALGENVDVALTLYRNGTSAA